MILEEDEFPGVGRTIFGHHESRVHWNAVTKALYLPQGTFYTQINVTTAHGQQITCFGDLFTL